MRSNYHFDHYFKPPRLFEDVELTQIGRIFCTKDFAVNTHLHLNWYELTIITDGAGILTTNGTDIPVKRNDIYLSLPADEHAIRSDKDSPLKYDYISVYPRDKNYLAEFERLNFAYRDPASRLFADSRIQTLVENAIAEFGDTENKFSYDFLANTFRMIIIYILRDFETDQSSRETFNPKQSELFCYYLMNYIDTHIFTLKSLTELATVSNYSYIYISKLFRSVTGRTLSDYYQNSRLKKAATLIRESKLKIGEIAELLNYQSVYSFSKAYKNAFGYSPTDTPETD